MSFPDWFAPSYLLGVDERVALSRWVKTQNWPEGTVLKDPFKYHITAFYARHGFSDPELARWIYDEPKTRFNVKLDSVKTFDKPDGKDMAAVVLTCASPQLVEHALKLQEKAHAHGVDFFSYEQFIPHVTIALSPQEITLPAPMMSLSVHGPVELHQHHIDSSESRQHWTGGYEGEGTYQHYKGSVYKVLGVGLGEGDRQPVVIYRSHPTRAHFCTRPLESFNETVDGTPRFLRIGDL
jgi:Protein of unknown function (DUF1653)